MKILVLSDLHLEFGFEKQSSFINMLDPNVDVVVLAGDICMHHIMQEAMSMICKRFIDSKVIWVHGNHEYYQTSKDEVHRKSLIACNENKNLIWLNDSSVVINEQRFVGSTLWFRDSPTNAQYERYMNDFFEINNFKSWVYEDNKRSIEFFDKTVNHNDIVITHHLPLQTSIARRFKNNELNSFFLCDMKSIIREHGPKLWIHGHTHDAFDYNIMHSDGETITRVICNPRGYWPDELNPDFNNELVVNI